MRDVISMGKAVVCPVFGVFSFVKNLTRDLEDDAFTGEEVKDTQICYVPSGMLMQCEAFSYSEQAPFNLPFLTVE